MKKAVRLCVTLYVRGEDEPAHDFARSSARAVREIIAAGARTHPELRVTVRRVVEDDDDEEDYDASDDEDTPTESDGRDTPGDGADGTREGHSR